MTHRLKTQQYLTLLAVVLTASFGDALLSRGMAQVGPVDLHHLPLLLEALTNLNVIAGIVLLIGFFASYTTALSWADLTFVMPATAFGNVVIALIARFMLHEHLSLSRWIGILLLTSAVGFVANRPARTDLTEAIPTPVAPPLPVPDCAFTTVGPNSQATPNFIAAKSSPADSASPEAAPTELPATRSGVAL